MQIWLCFRGISTDSIFRDCHHPVFSYSHSQTVSLLGLLLLDFDGFLLVIWVHLDWVEFSGI